MNDLEIFLTMTVACEMFSEFRVADIENLLGHFEASRFGVVLPGHGGQVGGDTFNADWEVTVVLPDDELRGAGDDVVAGTDASPTEQVL